MKFERADVYFLAFGVAAILAASMFYSSVLAPVERYAGCTAGNYVYVVDRVTGDVRPCTFGDCEAVQRWRLGTANQKGGN
jgi:hypothetical protein